MTTTRKRQRLAQRRDPTGHLDPKYAADLRLRSLETARSDLDIAFLGRARSSDSLAEVLGRGFVEAATTGEDRALDALNEGLPEDAGGPFVMTRGRDEFARGRDASNPKGATREPFPTVSAGDDDQEDSE
jgi:phosphatidylserine/phosphatidylglycerophosphate/cardiolipin synthase-like enzyme